MDFALNDEQKMMIDTLRRFIAEELHPLEQQVEDQQQTRFHALSYRSCFIVLKPSSFRSTFLSSSFRSILPVHKDIKSGPQPCATAVWICSTDHVIEKERTDVAEYLALLVR